MGYDPQASLEMARDDETGDEYPELTVTIFSPD
jgi:hypothetical protein